MHIRAYAPTHTTDTYTYVNPYNVQTGKASYQEYFHSHQQCLPEALRAEGVETGVICLLIFQSRGREEVGPQNGAKAHGKAEHLAETKSAVPAIILCIT